MSHRTFFFFNIRNNILTYATSECSDQHAHLRSLIRLFADRICFLQPLGYPNMDKREHLPYWVDVQADLSLCWSHRSYCRVVMRCLIYKYWVNLIQKRHSNCSFLIDLGLTTRQPLCVILCRLPEKGRRETEEIVEKMKERDRGERKMNESEETEVTCYKNSRLCPTVSQ